MFRPFNGYQEHIVAPVPFLWTSVFATGNEELDAKHKLVFRLINTLLQCEGVPSALECLADLQKAFEDVFAAEESYMESVLCAQKTLTENLADRRGEDESSYSTLGSDHKTANDRRGLRYTHPTTGKLIELDGPPLSEQVIDQHMTKHSLFLEDLESIRRRLDFSGLSRRFDQDADFRGKRELEYIANWYIHHAHLDDANLRTSNALRQKLSDGSILDSITTPAKDMEAGIARPPKLIVKFETADLAGAVRCEPLKDAELDTLRHHPNLIFTRDWLAFIQQQFVVGICVLRLPRVGRSSRIVLANAVWTEFTRLYPWLAAKAEYESVADGCDVVNVRKTRTGSCWVRKQKLFGGNNVRLRVISVAVPVTVRSRLFSTDGEYIADLSFFSTRDSIHIEDSAIISSAFARQRTALLTKSFLGDLSEQTLTSTGASLGWQHAPLGTPIFDNLVSWLAVELLADPRWMENEMPNITLQVLPEVFKTRVSETILSLREGIAACARIKSEQGSDSHLASLAPRHAASHISIASEQLGLTPLRMNRENSGGGGGGGVSKIPEWGVNSRMGAYDSEETGTISHHDGDDAASVDSSRAGIPLNALIRSFGAAAAITHEVSGLVSQNDVVRELADELGDLRKYMQPSRNDKTAATNKKGKKSHKLRRKRLLD